MAKQYGNFTDFISVARASSGTCLRKVKFGPNLVANGTFDTDLAGWSESGGSGDWSWSAGRAKDSGTGAIMLNQTITTEVGKVYLLSATAYDVSGGSPSVFVGGNALYQFSSGTSELSMSKAFVATSTSTIVSFSGSLATWEIDNVSIQECQLDHKDGELILFNHPENVARVEYDEYGRVIGTLIEEARTNLVTYSEDFTDASWIEAGNLSTITAASYAGPCAGTSATLLVDDSSGGTGFPQLIYGVTLPSSGTYTFSCWMKASGLPYGLLRTNVFDTSGNGISYFNLSTGEVAHQSSNHSSTTIEECGNGFYRCSITFSSTTDLTGSLVLQMSEDGTTTTVDLDGTSSIIVYGAQIEAGAFPTSYIPTSGSTATRAVDIESIGADQFGTNQAAGTIVVTYNPLAYKTNQTAFNLGRLSPTDGISWYSSSGHHRVSAVGLNSTTSFPIGLNGEPVGGTEYTSAVYYAQSDVGISVDGAATVSASSYDPPPLEALVIGDDQNGNDSFNGHIKSIKYYPRRLTNDQLEALSS